MRCYKILLIDHRTYCINSLGDSLSQQGHTLAFQSSWRPEEVEFAISRFQPDILLSVGYNRRLFSFFADYIPDLCTKYKLFHIYWATEDYINHDNWSLPYIKRSKPNLIWTIHPACIELYHKIGIPANYLNFAYNPRMFPGKMELQVEKYNIAFVGATHFFKRTYRFDSIRHLLIPLVKRGIKIDIWGSGWRKETEKIMKLYGVKIPVDWLHGHLLYGNTPKVYHQAKIVLGVQNAEDQVSQRTFEILGSGGFMLASRTPALLELFTDTQELVLTSSPEETIELVKFYLDRPNLRFKIGQRARRKVLDKYTYHKQLVNIWPQAEKLLNEFKCNGGC